jgi:hypothetical protein
VQKPTRTQQDKSGHDSIPSLTTYRFTICLLRVTYYNLSKDFTDSCIGYLLRRVRFISDIVSQHPTGQVWTTFLVEVI